MGMGRWQMNTWLVMIIASFNKRRPVAFFSLFAEIHFQPSCSNCVLIWNYLCWFLSPGKWRWGILHLVVNDFILYFPGEGECAYQRSPLLVFQYLLHSCERFYLKKGIWVYCLKLLAFLHLQSNSDLNSLYSRESGQFRQWYILWYKIAYAECRYNWGAKHNWLDPCWWDNMWTLEFRTGFCTPVTETVRYLIYKVYSRSSCSS